MLAAAALGVTAAALVLAAAALGALLVWRRHCLSLVAQASHELRGPLRAALLGLHGLGEPGDGTRLAAIDLELRRAARAVEDLSAAAGGRRAAESAAEVELGELLEDAGRRGAARRAPASISSSRRPRGRSSCAPTGCGSPRRWRTSSPTRSSTEAARVRVPHGRRPRVRGSR